MIKFLKCQICDYRWRRRSELFPKKCPNEKCQSKYWKTGLPEYMINEWLYREYIILGRTAKEIGKDYDKKPETIYYWLGKFKIKAKERKKL